MLHFGMLPLGRVIRLWRIERRLSQESLALGSGIARPNLSMIEQGARDCTLGTLRRLAHALGVRPGVLADGIAPGSARRRRWSRESLDRIARHAAGLAVTLSENEREAAELVRSLSRRKLAAKGPRMRRLRLKEVRRTGRELMLRTEAKLGPAVLRNLLARLEKLTSGIPLE